MSLAARQAELVAALTAGAPVPAGMDPVRLGIAARALLYKRAGEVARRWPLLAAGLGPDWHRVFAEWAGARPTAGSLRDGWDLARELQGRAALPEIAERELALVEARWRYDGRTPPRPRRLGIRRVADGRLLTISGRVMVIGRSDSL
ncbi:hypothetical protein D1871_19875 [Nakamurella silvestris]|nr:hypothetical protein D1871_19875 [Nakamurella silvestris]